MFGYNRIWIKGLFFYSSGFELKRQRLFYKVAINFYESCFETEAKSLGFFMRYFHPDSHKMIKAA